MLRSPKTTAHFMPCSCSFLVSSKKLWIMSRRGALTWFESVWRKLRCGSYWLLNHFFLNQKLNNKIENEKNVYIGIWEHSFFFMFFVGKPLGESDLIEFYFIIFRATVWKIIEFLSGFCCWKFKQIAKHWVWKEKISWAFNVFTLMDLEIFNSQMWKNKECVHTWANGTSYTSKDWVQAKRPLGGERGVRMAGFFACCGWVGLCFLCVCCM